MTGWPISNPRTEYRLPHGTFAWQRGLMLTERGSGVNCRLPPSGESRWQWFGDSGTSANLTSRTLFDRMFYLTIRKMQRSSQCRSADRALSSFHALQSGRRSLAGRLSYHARYVYPVVSSQGGCIKLRRSSKYSSIRVEKMADRTQLFVLSTLMRAQRIMHLNLFRMKKESFQAISLVSDGVRTQNINCETLKPRQSDETSRLFWCEGDSGSENQPTMQMSAKGNLTYV